MQLCNFFLEPDAALQLSLPATPNAGNKTGPCGRPARHDKIAPCQAAQLALTGTARVDGSRPSDGDAASDRKPLQKPYTAASTCCPLYISKGRPVRLITPPA